MVDFDVVELGPADHPQTGDEAPDFTRPLVTREFWEDRSLSSFEGRVVLVFTPMIGSFPAQYTWDEIADRGWADLDATVLGVSVGTPYAHAQFLDDRALPFALFADPANGVAEAYGIAHELDGMADIAEPRLAFFAIEDGIVDAAWVSTDWPSFPDYDDLEETLGIA